MSRILLVDDSPHAQRMAERILADEGYEVVAVSNADSALIRMEDVDPDVVLADTVMPGRTGFEICQYLKMNPRHRHVRVILTAGVMETMDEQEVRRVEADGSLKKPFEASVLLAAVKPLAEAAAAERSNKRPGAERSPGTGGQGTKVAPFVAVVDSEQVKAAVTLALDAAMETMVDEVTRRVVAELQIKKTEPEPAPAEARLEPPKPVEPPPAKPSTETVRRVTRLRSGSILGLDAPASPGPWPPAPGSRPQD
ncbi:MAG: response regulator [Acidobacteriia bacterium]|nr:response regulator [Terriglobia bacterium]